VSGACKRSRTPDGFQAEERSIRETPQTYIEMSPFFSADQINTPLLMYHGGPALGAALTGPTGPSHLLFIPPRRRHPRASGDQSPMDLTRFPRRRYTPGFTPIEFLPNLTRELGGPEIFIKRDDLLGLAGGGNKTRKLEFLVADALAQRADTLITVGAVQSNHCRLTLAAAAKEGLKCRLVLEQRVPGSYHPESSGNNFLFGLLGVEKITVVDGGSDLAGPMAR